MTSFRYNLSGNWYKGNTHLHSTASDGGKTFDELAEMYASHGYHFLVRTDHWVFSDVAQDPVSYPLLWLDGVELDGEDETGAMFHVACLGKLDGAAVKEARQAGGFSAALQAAKAQGALLILAHPHWSGNSLEDARRWPFDGVEVYNHVCHWLNGKGSGIVHWDARLRHDVRTLAFCVDDAHLRPEHPGWDGGWLMVNAPAGDPASLLEAIRQGQTYASCGPELYSLEFDGEFLHAQTSPVQFARLAGPGSHGVRVGSFDGQLMTEITLKVPPDWQYVYLEIEDARRARAWTNALFV